MSDQREAFEKWASERWGSHAYLHTSNTSGEWEAWQAALAQPQAQQEPVAVIGETFNLFWIGSGPIAPIIERHGLKVGDKLYAEPIAQQVAAVPAGFKLVAVKGFDELVFWLHRCSAKGHLDNCFDLVEPWEAFDYQEVSSATTPAPAVPLSADHIDKIREALVEKMLATGMLVGDDAWDHSLARAIERAHGVTEPGAGGESDA